MSSARAPEGEQLTDLLVALARAAARRRRRRRRLAAPRARRRSRSGGFDPLDCAIWPTPWTGPRPAVPRRAIDGAWRTAGDTVERLEVLARRLVAGEAARRSRAGRRPRAVLDWIARTLAPGRRRLRRGARSRGLLAGLDGRFVAPGPVRRADPRPARRAADRAQFLFRRHPRGADAGGLAARLEVGRRCWSSAIAQEHGDWPRALALSAWGTANMRTGGDDIAQALALIGVRPVWDGALAAGSPASRSCRCRARPAAGRRDAAHLRLLPRRLSRPRSICSTARCARSPRSTSRTSVNPLAARVAADERGAGGRRASPAEAARAARRLPRLRLEARRLRRRAAGADRRARLGDATPISPRPTSPGAAMPMAPAPRARPSTALFERRLAGVEAVLHNQDNREHDLLDSDDYYQFEGGLAVAVRHAVGRAAGGLSQRPFAAREPAHPHACDEEIGRVVRGRVAQPEVDRRRDAPRLQGRLRDRGDGRLPVRLRRHRARRRPSFRRPLRRLSRRRRGARLHRREQPGGAARDERPAAGGAGARAVAAARQRRPGPPARAGRGAGRRIRRR